jgi:hypothetical protein
MILSKAAKLRVRYRTTGVRRRPNSGGWTPSIILVVEVPNPTAFEGVLAGLNAKLLAGAAQGALGNAARLGLLLDVLHQPRPIVQFVAQEVGCLIGCAGAAFLGVRRQGFIGRATKGR